MDGIGDLLAHMTHSAYKGSLKLKLIVAFLCLSLIPVIIIAIFSSTEYIAASEKEIADYSNQLVVQTKGKLDVMLDNVEDISLQIASSADVQNLLESLLEADASGPLYKENESRIEDIIGNIISARNEIVGVNFLLPDGNNIISSGEKLIQPEKFLISGEYRALKRSDGLSMWKSTYFNDDALATYSHVTTYFRKIKSLKNGKDLGVLAIGVKEFALVEMYSYLDLGPDGEVFITDQDGSMISHLNKNTLSKPSEYAFVYEILKNGRPSEKTIFSEVGGKKVMVAYDRSSLNGWYMFYIVDYGYVMDPIIVNNRLIIVLLIIIVVLAVILSLFISFTISKPVEELSRTMKKVEGGDLNVRAEYTKGSNEIATLYTSFNKMIEKINDLIKRVYQAEILKQKAEINALQSQINPHFLYNTLAMIDGIAVMRGDRDISRIAETLGDMFRYSLSGGNFATLFEEVEQASNYLIIQKYFKRDKLDYSIKIAPEAEACVVSKLLLQPIIENAVVHGIENSLKKGLIAVDAQIVNDELLITVNDTGIGIAEKELEQLILRMKSTKNMFTHTKNAKRYHIGLGNIYWRIKNLYGEGYGLSIRSKPGEGTTVTMLLPRVCKMMEDGDGT